MGLSNLRKRVASLDGRVEIESEAGKGTTVRATLPA
jgi:signal transduction histidine kinase